MVFKPGRGRCVTPPTPSRSAARTSRLRAAIAALALLSCLTAPNVLDAAVPGTVMVAGALQASGGGAVVDGNYQLTFKLYNVPQDGTAVWSEGPLSVAVVSGAFRYALGTSKALDAALLGNLTVGWLGVTVGSEPELPRLPLRSVLWVHKAAMATSLACSGCVSVAAMKFDAPLDLGGNALKAKRIEADTLGGDTVAATSFVGDGSKLSGIVMPSGTCPQGEVASGVGNDGKLSCISVGSTLPNDAVDELSGGVVNNQFVDVVSSAKTPLGIDDNNPVGTADDIDVPDLGIAQKLTVTLDLSNSDMSKIAVHLFDPANTKYTLYDKNGAGKTLVTTYPDPTKTLTGDLTTWHGKNPKGKWRLLVIDSGFMNNGKDGAINKWSINIQTLSNKKILIKGDLVVQNEALAGGAVTVGASNAACTQEIEGSLKRGSAGLQWCDGKAWRDFGGRGATYRWQVWSTYHTWGGNWFGGNNADIFGGVSPATWGNSSGQANNLSSETAKLRAFFVRVGPEIGTLDNANVYSHEWRNYSSNNSRHVAALFRVRNTTSADINWTVSWYRTAYGSWGERASIALNGANVWDSGSSQFGPHSASSHTMSIPKARTSTVIFVASSSSNACEAHSTQCRALFMAFYNNCLKLPTGLEFVDDLETKPDGWTN